MEVRHQVLSSEFEALLVEASLIQSHQPHYNINLKDDKSPLYLIITTEKFPRLLTARKRQLTTTYAHLNKRNIFGPFDSGLDARKVIKATRRIFKFCSYRANHKPTARGCFYYQIGLCSGACTDGVTYQAYKAMIGNLRLFIRGKSKRLLTKLKQEMLLLSQKQEYERAGEIRDQYQSLERLFTKRPIVIDDQLPILEEDVYLYQVNRLVDLLNSAGILPRKYQLNRIEAYDISNTAGQEPTASVVVFTKGKPDPGEYRRMKIHSFDRPNDPAMIAQALERRLSHPEWKYPDLIIIDGGRTQLKAALKVTAQTIPTISLVKRPDRLVVPLTTSDGVEFRFYRLDTSKPVSRLVASLRDEAHRFAKNYHIKLRSRAMLNQYDKKHS